MEQKENLRQQLSSTLSEQDFQQLEKLTDNYTNKVYEDTKRKQREKFSRLSGDRQNGNERTRKEPEPESSQDNNTNGVMNLSQRKLTTEEERVLSLGMNFAIAPKTTPILDIVASVEQGLQKLDSTDLADNLRQNIERILTSAKQRPEPNLDKSEQMALKSLQKDKSIIILPADKGNVTVVLDKADYDKKITELLQETTYTKMKKDPTKRIETDIQRTLVKLQDKGEITPSEAFRLRPGDSKAPHLYGLPKIHKDNVPLRPIVSSIGSPTYDLAKFLARIISPLAGNTTSFVQNSTHFTDILKEANAENCIIVSFDVKSLFTNVPLQEALQVIEQRLSTDVHLRSRTLLSIESIMELLRKCLTTTYFTFEGEYYQQDDGAAMGSPLSPIVANIYMEFFEEMAMNLSKTRPRLWVRYVDDTFILWEHGKRRLNRFLTQLNSQRPSIQFTMEVEDENRLPFLDVEVHRDQKTNKLSTTVYRKQTHNDRYIHFRSYHPHHVKAGVIKTLVRRGDNICSKEEDKKLERKHISKVFNKKNGYPTHFVNRSLRKKNTDSQDTTEKPKATISIPYVKGTSDKIRRVLGKSGIRVAFRTDNTIRSRLTKVKPRLEEQQQKGVIYKIPCRNSNQVYIGETGRKLATRLQEHKRNCRLLQREKSAVAEHSLSQDHRIDFDAVKVIDKEGHFYRRRVKEAFWIKNSPNFNQDKGLNLSCIWNRLLKQTTINRTRS